MNNENCIEYNDLINQLVGLQKKVKGLEHTVHSLEQEKGDLHLKADDLKHTVCFLQKENGALRHQVIHLQRKNKRNPFTLVLIDGDGMNVSLRLNGIPHVIPLDPKC